MAMTTCSECGASVSDKAAACLSCGNPIAAVPAASESSASGETYCKSCQVNVTPVVTSVGGGSCTVGKRETWKCPKCRRIIHKSGCFVATATYGDEDALEVMFLRAFRDQYLKRSAIGQGLVSAYYAISPFLARLLERMPFLQRPSRWCLDSVVNAIERFTLLRRTGFRKPLP